MAGKEAKQKKELQQQAFDAYETGKYSPEQGRIVTDVLEQKGADKAALTEGLISAGGGLAGGIARGLLEKEQPEREGKAAIPSGSVGSVRTSAPSQLSSGRMGLDVSPRQSLALEMLRKGGYS